MTNMTNKYSKDLEKAFESIAKAKDCKQVTLEELYQMVKEYICKSNEDFDFDNEDYDLEEFDYDNEFGYDGWIAVFPFDYHGFSLLTMQIREFGESGFEFEVYVYCIHSPVRFSRESFIEPDGKLRSVNGFGNYKSDYPNWNFTEDVPLREDLMDLRNHCDSYSFISGGDEFLKQCTKSLGTGFLVPERIVEQFLSK